MVNKYALLFLASCWGLPLCAQSAALSGALRTIDVTVVDSKGEVVLGPFTKEDFVLTEDGAPKEITGFLGNGRAGEAGSVPVTVTIVVDHLGRPIDPPLRQALQGFLDRLPANLPYPTRILELDSAGLHSVAAFTRDREVLKKGQLAPQQGFLDAGAEAQWGRFFGALINSANSQSSLAGRKNLVWVGSHTEGISTGEFLSHEKVTLEAKRILNLFLEERTTLFDVETEVPRSADNLNTLSPKARSEDLAQNHGFRASKLADPFSNIISFDRYSEQSGGRAYYDPAGEVAEMEDAVRWGTSGYAITYQASVVGSDGKFKRISVTMKDPNLRPQTKTGYYAVQPFLPVGISPAAPVDAAKAEMREAAVTAAPKTDLTVMAKGLKHNAADDTVSFEVDLVPAQLQFVDAQGSMAAAVTMSAASLGPERGPERALLGTTTKTVEVKIAAASTQVKTGALHLSMNVKNVKGTTTLRFVVGDTRSGKLGTFDVTAEALTAVP